MPSGIAPKIGMPRPRRGCGGPIAMAHARRVLADSRARRV
ncbi:hypothetical protein BURPS668_0465 [Burkholderia pseudomallei 668]|nr:hypothetical protein BURPS668_0465 [Burkholderia pseudomallei 668]